MGRLSVGARLFYIGLWNIADDAGFLEWHIAQVGAELFPYWTAKRRERDIERWTAELVETKRLCLDKCGHAVIPTFREHQHLAGPTRRVETYFNDHKAGRCPRVPA